MEWPQITWLVLCCIGLGLALALDGQPRTGRHNFFVSLLASALVAWLLWSGGFFSGGAC
jgi:hypothetical protein